MLDTPHHQPTRRDADADHRVNGTTLYYERSGVGPAIVFVHGQCGDANVWADQARRLADRYTCVRYDRRGHSRSARGEGTVSTALHADDASALIEGLGLAPCLLVGSSGGAVIAVDVALRHARLLRGAVFSEPPLFSLDPESGQALLSPLIPRLDEAIATGGVRAGVDAFFSFVCPGLWSSIDDVARERYRANREIGFADLRAPSLVVGPADLATVTVPALVIAGTASHRSFRSIARRLAAALPDARFIELEGKRPRDVRRTVRRLRPCPFRVCRRSHPAHRQGRSPVNAVSRIDVRSADGTSIAVFVDGEGPPLVMVHGSMSDHTTSGLLVDELRNEVTTFSIDRRGFGASGDADVYAIEREFEDVAAVVDAVAARTGEPVAVWGHSYGANCALGGAALSANVHRLALYEPSLGMVYEPGALHGIEKKVGAGDLEGALLDVLVGIAGMTDAEVAAMRASTKMPWEARLATVPTLPRECRAEEEWEWQPGQFDAIAAPTLMLTGAQSPAVVTEVTERVAAAIPHVRVSVIEGEGHFAHRNQPAMVAGMVLDFVRG